MCQFVSTELGFVATMPLTIEHLRAWLANVSILPRRMVIVPQVTELVPAVLRGVWGAALRAESPEVYRMVFAPGVENPIDPNAVPGYLIRLADGQCSHQFDWFLFGRAVQADEPLRRAWQSAGKMGIGKRREQFQIAAELVLGPDGLLAPTPRPWTLDQARWPLPTDPQTTPCRIVFEEPVRILQGQKQLVENVQLADVIGSFLRRIRPFVPPKTEPPCPNFFPQLIEFVRSWPCGPWRGDSGQLKRWSARQQTELELRGVIGSFELPEGPGPFWPLLAAAQWTHVGKGTVLGLGRPRIRPMA